MDAQLQRRDIIMLLLGSSTILGLLMIVLGLLAVARPFFASVAIEIYIGWLFIFSGILQLIYAFQTRDEGQFVLKLLFGLLHISTGLLLLFYPLQGAVSLTLVIGSFIFAGSMTQIVQAIQARPAPGWPWTLFSGLSGLLLASMILLQWPSSALWFLGLLVGIELMTDGFSIIGLRWIRFRNSLSRRSILIQ